MKIIDRYILKSHLLPFGYAFLIIVFILILQFFTVFAERFIGKGIGFSTIIELILLQSVWMIGLAVPMAVLVATVLTFAALTTTSEMTVFRASGISLYRLMAPVLVAGLVLSGLVERFNNVVIPVSNYYAQSLMLEVARTKPDVGLTENAFSKLVDGYSIFVRDSNEKTKELRGVVIYDSTNPESSIMVTSEKGTIEFSPDYQYLLMTLFNGEIHEVRQNDFSSYRKIAFTKDRFIVESSKLDLTRSVKNRIRSGYNELSADELIMISDELRRRIVLSENAVRRAKAQHDASMTGREGSGESPASMKKQVPGKAMHNDALDRQVSTLETEMKNLETTRRMLNRYMVAYHKKYSLSFACFIFVLVGAPLGVLARKGGFGLGAVISLLLFVLYWVLMILGENIAKKGMLDPLVSVWFANTFMIIVGTMLVVRLNGPVFGGSR
ncbi:MAG: YjgP/YjgQ family permease [Chlorobiaceae bacterium]|nr:YjgP/YjgQ family permease [Chlorobiaceae bacterium]